MVFLKNRNQEGPFMEPQKFGAFLQARRKEMGMTQAQLSEKLHVTDKAVSRWERGVGLPDIQLLEPLAQALDLSLTELIRSERIEENTLTRAAADEAVAETLALADKRRRRVTSWLSTFLIWAVELFFMGITIVFVDVYWVRFTSFFLIHQCGSTASRLVRALLYPETVPKGRSWKYHLKTLVACIALWLYPLIFLQQPYIGLENCGILALVLTAMLTAWGLWEVHKYVENMPDDS